MLPADDDDVSAALRKRNSGHLVCISIIIASIPLVTHLLT
jgi:hypothetical protein